MRPLTDGQYWGGMVVVMLFIIAIVWLFLWHWKKINRDILNEDRKRLNEWAHNYAEQLARHRLAELLRSVRINVPVQLINESNISWGDDKNEQRKSA